MIYRGNLVQKQSLIDYVPLSSRMPVSGGARPVDTQGLSVGILHGSQ